MSAKLTSSGLHLPARFIPTPTSVSAEAQAFLSRDFGVMPPEIPHTDKQAWRAYVAQVDAMMAPMMARRAAAFPATVEAQRLSHCTLYEVTPEMLDPALADCALLHIHGGAFIVGGGEMAASTARSVAGIAGIRSFSVDYRMPPDHPYPHGLDDCVEAYRWLMDRFPASKIGIEGSSAGANLVAATILRARDEGLPLPAAAALHTAGVDLTHSGDTTHTNQHIDVVLRGPQPETMLLYAGGHDMTHPYLSPLFGDFAKGFPPTLLTSGTRDLLLSPTVMLHRKLRKAGVEAMAGFLKAKLA
jgi:epsilon-lactone hydrolase